MLGRDCIRIGVAALLALPIFSVCATELDASIDMRLVGADAPTALQDGGLGLLRYGDDRDGVQLGRARFALAQNITELLSFKIDASAWGQHDKNPVDVTEAYFQVHPYPFGNWRARLKLGAFYAPMSLENRADGWESPYTLSASAMDSWVAEELRTIGSELKVEWLGTHAGHDFDVGAAFGVYGWNQGSGAALARSGFTITDWQSSLFGRVGRPNGIPGPIYEYRQYDNHAGTYEGLDIKYLDRVTLEALHYDNHADPTADDNLDRYAWQTRFDTVGGRAENDDGWTAIVQWMAGETFVEPDDVGLLGWRFVTRYALVSKRSGPHTVSGRFDDFKVSTNQTSDYGAQNGHAVTLAYRFEPDEHWRFTLEGVRTRGFQANRQILAGEAPFATESLVQVAIRYALSNH